MVNLSRFYRVNFIRPYWVNFTVFSRYSGPFAAEQGDGRVLVGAIRNLAMYLDATCEGLPSSKWEALMKGARRVSYRMLVSRVKSEIPELYRALALNLYNPWADQCRQTATHFILVHSAIEYFIHK